MFHLLLDIIRLILVIGDSESAVHRRKVEIIDRQIPDGQSRSQRRDGGVPVSEVVLIGEFNILESASRCLLNGLCKMFEIVMLLNGLIQQNP